MSKMNTDMESFVVLRYGRPPSIERNIVARLNWFYGIEEEINIACGFAFRNPKLGVLEFRIEMVKETEDFLIHRLSRYYEQKETN